jgi:polysaccharide deacetylase family protein (PEP-CTERM system associated)
VEHMSVAPGEAPFVLLTEDVLRVAGHLADGPRNAFTVDVEDWYQSCVDYDATITERVVRNVDRMLTLLDDCGVKGTFFVQGRVAEAFPELIHSLAVNGHEVQSHGHTHRPVSGMSKVELRAELDRGKKTVEDASGTAVTAFRAPDFSIGRANLWAFDVLADVGFDVDSSIFPMQSRHYGIAGWQVAPHHLVLGERRILEVPVAVWDTGRLRFPVAGGGYLRLLPWRVLLRGLRAVEADARPAVIYCHPYEFAAEELDEYPELRRRTRIQQSTGRTRFPDRVRALFDAFPFGRLDDVLAVWGLR